MVCFARDGSTCSVINGMSCSAIVGCVVCSVLCSIGCSSLAVCFVVYSTVTCFGCSGLHDIGMVVVWADEEENLLKIFVLRP